MCHDYHKESIGESTTERTARLFALAEDIQRSVVTPSLTQILNDKKHDLPFLLNPQLSIPRPLDLRVDLRDNSDESLSNAARLVNKPFKKALRAMLTRLNLPQNRLEMGVVKRLAGITEKRMRGTTHIFDLNRATIVFENAEELQQILAALPSFFEIVCLDNKFLTQWEEATQPPCLQLNLRLQQELLPPELVALLIAGGGWVVEIATIDARFP